MDNFYTKNKGITYILRITDTEGEWNIIRDFYDIIKCIDFAIENITKDTIEANIIEKIGTKDCKIVILK